MDQFDQIQSGIMFSEVNFTWYLTSTELLPKYNAEKDENAIIDFVTRNFGNLLNQIQRPIIEVILASDGQADSAEIFNNFIKNYYESLKDFYVYWTFSGETRVMIAKYDESEKNTTNIDSILNIKYQTMNQMIESNQKKVLKNCKKNTKIHKMS